MRALAPGELEHSRECGLTKVLTVGVDSGSNTTKVAVMRNGTIIGSGVTFTGYSAEKSWKRLLEDVLSDLGVDMSSVGRIVSTGYGRNVVGIADKAITEITCHAAGAHFLDSSIRSIIDVGGQDSKFIALDGNGRVENFAMNDKCAAGTGRFLEVMARALEVDLDKFGEISLQSENPARISSLCTVFAESEVVSLISKGESRENIIAGIHEAIASRITSMINRVGVRCPVLMAGGVAKNIGVVKALERELGADIKVLETAQVNGAIGAAVLAAAIEG